MIVSSMVVNLLFHFEPKTFSADGPYATLSTLILLYAIVSFHGDLQFTRPCFLFNHMIWLLSVTYSSFYVDRNFCHIFLISDSEEPQLIVVKFCELEWCVCRSSDGMQ
jgi:hypothetical protein